MYSTSLFFIDIIQCKQNMHMVWICVFIFLGLLRPDVPK